MKQKKAVIFPNILLFNNEIINGYASNRINYNKVIHVLRALIKFPWRVKFKAVKKSVYEIKTRAFFVQPVQKDSIQLLQAYTYME